MTFVDVAPTALTAFAVAVTLFLLLVVAAWVAIVIAGRRELDRERLLVGVDPATADTDTATSVIRWRSDGVFEVVKYADPLKADDPPFRVLGVFIDGQAFDLFDQDEEPPMRP